MQAKCAEPDPENPYSDQFIAEVVKEFEIPPEHTAALKSHLIHAAELYRLSHRAPASMAEQLLWIREALEHLERTYSEFVVTLVGLSHPARDRLWHSLFESPNRPPNFQGLAQPFDPSTYPDEVEFCTVLRAFSKRIRTRLDDMPNVQRRGGRPKLVSLRVWVGRISAFWEHKLGRKFTYSEIGGSPKSVAYAFCSRLLRPLDSKVSSTQLITAVRSAVKPLKAKVTIHPSLLKKRKPSKRR